MTVVALWAMHGLFVPHDGMSWLAKTAGEVRYSWYVVQ